MLEVGSLASGNRDLGHDAGYWRDELQRDHGSTTAYRRLNPLTQLVIAGTGAAAALVATSMGGAVVVLVVLFGLGAIAGVLPRLWKPAMVGGAVVAALVGVVTVAAGRGPLVALGAAADAAARSAGLVLCFGLVALTIDLPALGLDLERRGFDRRVAFGFVASLGAAAGLRARIRTISAAQQSRGLRLGHGPIGRARTAVPIWLPVLVSSLSGLTERSLALESRAIGHRGRRALLWAPRDPALERVVRWLLLGGLLVVVISRAAGRLT